MNRKRLISIAIVLALVGAAGAAAWALYFRSVSVQVAQVERDVSVEVFGLGTVEARVASKIGFKASGVLVDLRADVGNRVAKGTVLARLDDREQQARSRPGPGRSRTGAGQSAKGNGQRRQGQSQLRERQEHRRASTSVASEPKHVGGARPTFQRPQKRRRRADVDLAESEVAVARAAISDAKAQGQQEAATLDFHTLTSPYDAMITARLKELGSALGAGEPVFTLIDPQQVWVLAYIDESKAGEIQIGEPAEIVLRSRPSQRF